MTRVILGLLALIVVLIGGVLAWGALLPATVTATRTARLEAPVERVFALVADPAGQTAWRGDVGEVTVEAEGRAWTETTAQGILIRFEEVERVEGARYALRFTSPTGFSGEWLGTFAAGPEADTTEVSFTETVTTPAITGRILARLFAPPGAHVDRYLSDLTAALAPG